MTMLKNALVLARKRVLICGALAGAVIAGWIAPLLRPLFQVPAGGIGAVTLAGYPKSFDYAVVALLVAGSAIGALSAALLAGRFSFPHAQDAGVPRRWARAWPGFILVSVLMIAIHDHPYAFMEMFHEGEHLAPASVYLDGGRPYRDIFVLHGLATDGGLDRIVLGKPPSLLKSRRFQTLLDALTVALLVPIAIELAATGFGAAAGVALGFCAMGAALVPVFPYFRLLPLLSACWSLLRHLRTRSRLALFCAMASSSLGLLWSLEVGVYSSIAVAAWLVVLVIDGKKTFIRAAIVPALVAAFLPIAIILFCGADLYNFFRDSIWIIPNSIDTSGHRTAGRRSNR
ncbi:MAG TPA: hypothetical protein VEZ11_02385 [Thermoanaerobaculia bacterium]|nr:hypothetical protein [Thermoanaerobaculia bacterium]